MVGRIAFVVVEEIVKFWERWKSSGLMRNIVVFGFLCFGVLPSGLAVFCLVACLDWKLPVPFQQTLLRILPFVYKYTGIMLCYNTDQCILLSVYTDQLLLQCSVSLLGDVWNRCCCYVASCYQRELTRVAGTALLAYIWTVGTDNVIVVFRSVALWVMCLGYVSSKQHSLLWKVLTF